MLAVDRGLPPPERIAADPGTRLAVPTPVTVRITLIEERPKRCLRIDGRLTAHEVAELEQLVGTDPGAACLDLAELRSVDGAGLAELRRLRAQGFALRSVPQHLAWRIAGEEP